MTTQDIITLTKQLIAIPSTADNPAALRQAINIVADTVRRQCPDVTIEWFAHNGKPSFLAYLDGTRPKTFDILLNAHVDVVPAEPAQFTPREADGKLYGRGALDMKGTTASLTAVFCDMVHNVPYALGLQVVSDEEIGGYDGVRVQVDTGVRAKFVIVGEYANHRRTIYNAARGVCWAEIAFKGKASHGGHPWHGSNAVMKAGAFAGAVLKRYPTPDRETWTTTASIADLSTPNTVYNRVPDRAVLKIDFRFTQEDPVFQSRESFEKFVAGIDPTAKIVNLATFEPAVNVETLNPYVQGLGAAVRRVTKAQPKFKGRPGGSDGRHFALYGIDVVEFGLYGKNSHSDGEFVELSSFDEYTAIIRAFLGHPIPQKAVQPATAPVTALLHHQLLTQLVAMPTVSTNKAANVAAMQFIAGFLRERGMFVREFSYDGFPSLVATTRPHSRRPTVMLSAHTDVVPAANDSFTVRKSGDKLYGRGVMDMKFAIAAYLALVDTLQDELRDYDFGIMITSDEELGSRHGVPLLIQEHDYNAGVAIVPDSGANWQIERFAKGAQWVSLTAQGKSAHASRPWEGDDAIQRLLAALHKISELTPSRPAPKDTHITIGTINGGTTANQISDSASAMLDIRYGNVDDFGAMFPKIRDICQKQDVIAELQVSDAPCAIDLANPYVKTFSGILTAVTGETHDTSYSYGATDGRHFSAQNIPVVAVQPPSGGHHTENEWLSLTGFDQFNAILEQYVRAVAARPSQNLQPTRRGVPRLGASAHIWYATYGSGLSKDNFMAMITGGTIPGSTRHFTGCADTTPPVKDTLVSLPYRLYFGGACSAWGGGGHVCIETEPHAEGQTISRAYLITVQQFEEIAAQQNDQTAIRHLPLKEAMQNGHATICEDAGDYNELIYCSSKDGHPMFTLAPAKPHRPIGAPSEAYMRLLCKGLSESHDIISMQAAVDYVLETPGVADRYQKHELTDFYKAAKK